ncbi:50S ribosomal protein L23 [Candidatus Saccharibacteria bacterium]|nr:50S ribosomal protein L23 [Candidatus Saccharibacteria bacterium]
MEIYPRATEKTYREQAKRTYVFLVPDNATKQSVAEAVKTQFNVTVIDVRILTRKGKTTKYSKGKHAYPGTTFRRDKRFAYVTLKDGDSIKVFEEPEEDKKADKKAKKSAKADKKSEKKGDK